MVDELGLSRLNSMQFVGLGLGFPALAATTFTNVCLPQIRSFYDANIRLHPA